MKVCFIYPSWDNEKTLEVYRKMTPGCSGKWKDMEAVTNMDEADYCVVIDYANVKVPEEKTIYVGAHPYMMGYRGYYNFDKKKCFAKLDLMHTFGFGEWWLKHDYDYLSALRPMTKRLDACYIVSDSPGAYGQDRRKEFAKEISDTVNVYGRIKDVGNGPLGNEVDYWHGKEAVLADHRYSIEVDVGPTRNYFSERFFDSLLMWCMPLYWGSTNIEQYMPEGCFRYIDIYGSGEDVRKIIKSSACEDSLEAIEEARDLLLNKYQIWPRI